MITLSSGIMDVASGTDGKALCQINYENRSEQFPCEGFHLQAEGRPLLCQVARSHMLALLACKVAQTLDEPTNSMLQPK